MDKYGKYIPYVILLIFGFMLWSMSKTQKTHTALLIGMAGKMGLMPDELPTETRNSSSAKEHEEKESKPDPKDIDEEIVRIAEKLYKGKSLGKDKEFYADYKKEIDEEVGFFLADDMERIGKAITEGTELTQEDADLYIQNLPTFQEELKLPDITAPVKIKPAKEKVELASEADRKHLLLTFFNDGIPRVIGALANLYAEETGLVASTGNTAKILDKLLAEGKLKNQKILHGGRNKVFYGLPEWFDGKKFKKEYIKTINA